MTRKAIVVPFLALSLLGAGPCVVVEDRSLPPGKTPPPVSTTCDHFDIFNQECTDNCAPTWDCDAAYNSLSEVDKYDLDFCSDCLVDNIANGICADCSDTSVGIDSCQAFMEDLLGIDCW